jgi:hypothetical protein
MLLAPCLVFVLSLRFSNRLRPTLRKVYRIGGGLIVFLGSGISLYLAMYTGDQGGIGAFFFQVAVILTYAALSILLVIVNWLLSGRSDE